MASAQCSIYSKAGYCGIERISAWMVFTTSGRTLGLPSLVYLASSADRLKAN